MGLDLRVVVGIEHLTVLIMISDQDDDKTPGGVVALGERHHSSFSRHGRTQ